LNNIDWYKVVHQNPSSKASWATFESILWACIDCYIPRYNSLKPTFRDPVPRYISKCTTRKRRLWRKLKANPYSSTIHMRYTECVQQWRRSLEKREVFVKERIVESNDLGVFYKFVNKSVSNKHKITCVKEESGAIVTDDTSI